MNYAYGLNYGLLKYEASLKKQRNLNYFNIKSNLKYLILLLSANIKNRMLKKRLTIAKDVLQKILMMKTLCIIWAIAIRME